MARHYDYHCYHDLLRSFQHLPSEEVAVGGSPNFGYTHSGPIHYDYTSMGYGPQKRCKGSIHRIQQLWRLEQCWDSDYGWSFDDNYSNDWV